VYNPGLPGLRPKTPADLIRARQAIPWVQDDDLDELEPHSAAGGATLSFFTWGGGQLKAADRWRGAALIAALVLTVVLFSAVSFLPGWLFWALWAVVGSVSAFDAYRRVKAVRKFALTRTQVQMSGYTNVNNYRLLASAAAVDPHMVGAVPALAPALGVSPNMSPHPPQAQGNPAYANTVAMPATGPRFEVASPAGPRHVELADQLRKLYALRAAGVISDVELRERKVDILAAVAPDDRAALDQLLYELLPLADEGVLESADFEFLKGASAGR
jgi:hypothetical protein